VARPEDRELGPDVDVDEVLATWGPLLLGRPDPLMLRYLDDQAHRFAEAFACDLKSYREGTKVALGRKLALLEPARARLLAANLPTRTG